VRAVVCAALLATACRGGQPAADDDDDDDIDAPPAAVDVRPDVPHVDKSQGCVGTFGNQLVDGFYRLDAIMVAVVPPGSNCPRPNDSHIILEIRIAGDVYRMVAAVESQVGNPDMALAERDAPLVGPAWSEGVHAGVAFDYVANLGLHRLDFAPTPAPELIDRLTFPIEIGGKVSVFATVEQADDSAHLVHRNGSSRDGAIVLSPDTAPHYMLLRFDNQLF
jgi:hypothetical protein